MRCFACNARIDLPSGERVGFRDTCESCDADLHSCKNCALHEPSAYNECRESSSERVSDRERANRCDYFVPGDARGGDSNPKGDALADLEALFKK